MKACQSVAQALEHEGKGDATGTEMVAHPQERAMPEPQPWRRYGGDVGNTECAAHKTLSESVVRLGSLLSRDVERRVGGSAVQRRCWATRSSSGSARVDLSDLERVAAPKLTLSN